MDKNSGKLTYVMVVGELGSVWQKTIIQKKVLVVVALDRLIRCGYPMMTLNPKS